MELRTEQAQARVDLDGGRLASLCVYGHELLVTEGTKASRWGSFPMAPWAGRLRHGRLAWEGDTILFPITSPPHANHGVAHQQTWTQVDAHTISTALADPWPLGGVATQRFQLSDDALSVSIEISNDHGTMPALTGWHPWFRRRLDAGDAVEVLVEPGQAYEVDEEMIPTGNLIPPPPPPWNETFVDLAGPPRLRWAGALEVTVSSSFDHWVVFTEPDHAVCVEPQSGPPNQVNTDPYLVGPRRPLQGSMTLTWRSLAA
jgi:aldose 1-epimerase